MHGFKLLRANRAEGVGIGDPQQILAEAGAPTSHTWRQ
jgi:hypothetical protein